MCKSLYRMSRQLASFVLRALFAEWKMYKSDSQSSIVEDAVCIDGTIFSGAVPTNDTHSSIVEDADGIDGTIFLVLYLHDRVLKWFR